MKILAVLLLLSTAWAQPCPNKIELPEGLNYTPAGCSWPESTYCFTREGARQAAVREAALKAETQQLREQLAVQLGEVERLQRRLNETELQQVTEIQGLLRQCQDALQVVTHRVEILEIIAARPIEPASCFLPVTAGSSLGLVTGLGVGLWLSR